MCFVHYGNDFIMEVKDVNLKRFTAGEGMALKWKELSWDSQLNKMTEGYRWSPKEVFIDINHVLGEVEEIPFIQYKEETKYCCCDYALC